MRVTLLPKNINRLRKIIFQNRFRLQLKAKRITILEDEVAHLDKTIGEKDNAIRKRDEEIAKSNMEIKDLNNEIEVKESLIGEAEKKIKNREKEIESCKEIIRLLQRKKYASSSERVSSQQLSLFNELEDIINKEQEEEEKETITYTRRKPRRPRIPKSLPREERIIELKGKDRQCPHDGTEMEEIGEETSEKIEIIPAKVKVIKTIRKKYACTNCHKKMATAPLPPAILPKSIASPSLLSYIIVGKYADALPLYRQEKIFARIAAEITRQTMARWLIEVSQLMMPLYNLLDEKMLSGNYIQMDETTVQVLKEKGKKPTTKSYMWARRSPGASPIILLDYDPTRKKEVPMRLLEGFSGYLQCDGYPGYDEVCEKNQLIRLGCMDHCRRKFYDAYKASGKKGMAKRGLQFLKVLYKIEKEIKEFPSERKKEVRLNESTKVLADMKFWLSDIASKITPDSLGGKAVNYALNEWTYLTRYTEDGNLAISNIMVENEIRPFCIGRKNWLFSDTVGGAEASAMYYSFMATAVANGLEPFDYFNKMLEYLPYAQTVDDYELLLPLQEHFRPSDLSR